MQHSSTSNSKDQAKTEAPGAWTQALGHSAADKRIDLLRGIGRTGSISQAAREAGVSYKAAWQAIATLTNLAGVPLVERVVGGAGGGGARLTAQGQGLLQMAQAYDSARRSLATPSTAGAGSAAASLRVRTSMRNQLPGVIEQLQARGRQVHVHLRLGDAAGLATDLPAGGARPDGVRIVATITQESAELLGLQVGLAAIALCKATAVKVLAPDAPAKRAAISNLLPARVARVARAKAAEQGDELSVVLCGSTLELVGFAAPGTAWRRRQRVLARLDASAVVLALPG
ncbi:MAG: LysR family transcriptional regulator [Comamonadaceae bacterium]|nr:MAG: LysR family transcriptional regulator [Comamonadaceae bacterium]